MISASIQDLSRHTGSSHCRERIAASSVALLVMIACSCWGQTDIRELGDFSSILTRVERAIVFIQAFSAGTRANSHNAYSKNVRSGTGCVISSSGQVLTTLHTVSDAEIILCTVAGEEHEYRLWRVLEEMDIAVLRPSRALSSIVPYLRVNTTQEVRRLDEFLVVGFPLPDVLQPSEPVYAIGSIAAVRPSMSPDIIQMNLEFEGGMSGAPIVNRVGDIVGIIRSELSDTSFGFGVPAEEFAEILDPDSTSLSASPFDPALGLGITHIYGLGPKVSWQMSLGRMVGIQIGAALGRNQVGWLAGDGSAVFSMMSLRPGKSIELVPYAGVGGGYVVMTYGSVDVGSGWIHGAVGAQLRLAGPFTLWAQLLIVKPFGNLARPDQPVYPVLEFGVLVDLT